MGFRKAIVSRNGIVIFFSATLIAAIIAGNKYLQEIEQAKASAVEAKEAFIAYDKNKFFLVTKKGSSLITDGMIADYPIVRVAGIIQNEVVKKQIFELLKALSHQDKFNASAISEIHHDKVDGFTIWTNDGQTSVKLGAENLKSKSSQVNRVMQYLDQERVRARVIDARFKKKVVVRPRNDT